MKSKVKPSFWYMLKKRMQGRNFLYEYYFSGNGSVLDIGCGNGEFMNYNSENIKGFDINKEAVEALQRKNYDAKIGDVRNMPYEDECFDRAHCRNVIEHLYPEDAYLMLKESARVLKSGGLLVLGTEMPTKKIWGTFGHIKPYPPGAIKKLLREETKEEFLPLKNFEHVSTIYLGHYSKIHFFYFLSSLLAYYLPVFRREYFIVLRKR